MDDDEGSTSSGVEYLDRFKFGCLGYAIKRVGSMDLRYVEHVETGEVLPNGTAIKVAKDAAVREIISNWPRPVVDALFKKFTEMMERYELEADKMVDYDPVDKEAEIARLEEKIARLKGVQQAEPQMSGEAAADGFVDGFVDDFVAKTVGENLASEGSPIPEGGGEVVSNPGPRSSVIPTQATPPNRVPVEDEAPPEQPEIATFASEGVPEQPESGADEIRKVVNPGFIDKDDEDSLEQEAARLAEIRKRAGLKSAKEAAQANRVPAPRRAAPHIQAQSAAKETEQEVRGGVPVFRPPTGEISGREAQPDAPAEPISTENPKFRPPGS